MKITELQRLEKNSSHLGHHILAGMKYECHISVILLSLFIFCGLICLIKRNKMNSKCRIYAKYACCLWPCSLAVPVLAWWVCAFCGSMSRNSRRLNRQWFWFKSISEDGQRLYIYISAKYAALKSKCHTRDKLGCHNKNFHKIKFRWAQGN